MGPNVYACFALLGLAFVIGGGIYWFNYRRPLAY